MKTPISDTQWANFKADLKVSLSEEVFAQAWAEGQKLSIEKAMEEIGLALAEEADWFP